MGNWPAKKIHIHQQKHWNTVLKTHEIWVETKGINSCKKNWIQQNTFKLSKSHSGLQECSCGILVLALVAHWLINRQRPAKDSTKPISSSAVFVGVVLPQLIYIFRHGSALELSHPLMHIHRKSGSMSYMWSAMWMHKRVSADLSSDLNWHWDELIYHDYVWRWCHGLSDYSNSNSG